MPAVQSNRSSRLTAIAQQELQDILRSAGEVDAAYFYGRRNSMRWILERALVAALGMRRAGARMSQEIPAVRTEEVALLATEAEECLDNLAESLVGAHRHRLMASIGSSIPTAVSSSCGHLSSELSRERIYAVEAIHRSFCRSVSSCMQPSM